MRSEVFSEAEKRGHEQVSFFYFPEVGLKAVIAVHSTVLGPGLGGCRMRPYASESEAVEDFLQRIKHYEETYEPLDETSDSGEFAD